MKILLDGQVTDFDELAKIHEDACVFWDRDGMSEILAEMPESDVPVVCVWTIDELRKINPLSDFGIGCVMMAAVGKTFESAGYYFLYPQPRWEIVRTKRKETDTMLRFRVSPQEDAARRANRARQANRWLEPDPEAWRRK